MFCLRNVTYWLDVTLATHCHISTLSTLKFEDCDARLPPLPPFPNWWTYASISVYCLLEMLSLMLYSLLQMCSSPCSTGVHSALCGDVGVAATDEY